jgi:hypothetical protein
MDLWNIIVCTIALVIVAFVLRRWLQLKRAEFIRTYKLPAGLLGKLMERHPELTLKDSALVSRGLRQFFIAYLMSGKKFVSMPSVDADALWHEFILYTREYQRFCRHGFGGFMHHSPARVLSADKRNNEGLRRTWWYCCKYENINPRNPTRLPLLFALDEKLKISGGNRYHPQCEQLRKGGDGAVYCGGDFSSSSFDGGTAGFGDVSSGDSGSGDGSSGCGGGGCGGGGGD